MDATIVDASSSTKNEAQARDPEMSSTKKGIDWFSGMRVHIGVDAESGGSHSLETSKAQVPGSQVWDAVLNGGESSVRADREHVRAGRVVTFSGLGQFWNTKCNAPKGNLHPLE